MALAVHVLKEQIEKAKRNLKSVDENIKKITGRDPNERRPISEGQRLSTGSGRGRQRDTILGRRGRGQQGNFASAEPPSKRTADGDVFSRLTTNSGRRVVISRFGAGRQKEDEEDEVDEDEGESSKLAVQSSIVSTAKTITKKDLISAQNVGEKGKARNRRMFGVLLGTLARFQSDSNGPGQQMKQVQRQQEIERRLEEQTTEERKKAASQRRTLFNERKAQQKRIELLEQKIALADEVTEWEKEWALKSNFIMTKASPPIFFHPTDHTARTQKALKESKQRIEGIIEKHRECIEQTMKSIDAEIESLEKKSSEDGKWDGLKVCDKGINGSKNSSSKSKHSHDPEEEMDLDSMGPSVDIKVELDDESHHNQENLDEDYSDNGVAMKGCGFDDVLIKERPDSKVQTNQDKPPDAVEGDEDSDRENAVGNRDSGQNIVNISDLHEDGAGKRSHELCNKEDDSVADKQSEKFDNANTEVQEPSIKDTDLEKSSETTPKRNKIITDVGNAHTKDPQSSDMDENHSDEDRNPDKGSHSDSKSGGDTSSNERSSSSEEESDKDEQGETNNVSRVESSVAQKGPDTSTTEQTADEPQEMAFNKQEIDMSKKKSFRVEQQNQKITTGIYDSERRQGSLESSDSSSSSEDGSSDSSSSKKKKQKQRTKQRDLIGHKITPQQKSHKGRRHSRSRSRSRDGRTSSRSRDRQYNDGQKNRKRR